MFGVARSVCAPSDAKASPGTDQDDRGLAAHSESTPRHAPETPRFWCQGREFRSRWASAAMKPRCALLATLVASLLLPISARRRVGGWICPHRSRRHAAGSVCRASPSSEYGAAAGTATALAPPPSLATALAACVDPDSVECSVEMMEVISAAQRQLASVANALSACAAPEATECSVELMEEVVSPWHKQIEQVSSTLHACADDPESEECSVDVLEVVRPSSRP